MGFISTDVLEKSEMEEIRMLDYNEFKKELVKMVRDKTGHEIHMTAHAITDRSGRKRDSFSMEGREAQLYPAVFLDHVYNQYLAGNTLSACAEFVSAIYCYLQKGIGTVFYKDWDHAKENIRLAVIHKAWNQEAVDRLKGIPHVEFLDLVLYCRIAGAENDAGTVVKNDMLKEWNIDKKDLWATAFDNFKQEKFRIESIEDVIRSYWPEEPELEQQGSGLPIYVLTNKCQNLGAVGMLRVDLLESFAGLCGCNWYILPSSVHEVLLTPDKGVPPQDLRRIVQEVNREQVDEAEQLSDEVYYYRRGSWKLELAV